MTSCCAKRGPVVPVSTCRTGVGGVVLRLRREMLVMNVDLDAGDVPKILSCIVAAEAPVEKELESAVPP